MAGHFQFGYLSTRVEWAGLPVAPVRLPLGPLCRAAQSDEAIARGRKQPEALANAKKPDLPRVLLRAAGD